MDALVDLSLARRDDAGRITLHDLQRDYVRKQIEDLPALHRQLVEAYRLKCPDGWASGPNDGYFFHNLAHHLVEAGEDEQLRALLLDYDWIQAKLNGTNFQSLLADYGLVTDDAEVDLVKGALDSREEPLSLIQTYFRAN